MIIQKLNENTKKQHTHQTQHNISNWSTLETHTPTCINPVEHKFASNISIAFDNEKKRNMKKRDILDGRDVGNIVIQPYLCLNSRAFPFSKKIKHSLTYTKRRNIVDGLCFFFVKKIWANTASIDEVIRLENEEKLSNHFDRFACMFLSSLPK